MIDPRQATALLGAGVSVDAGLPTGFQLFDALVDGLVHRDWARDEVKRLARSGRPDMNDEHDAIRLETLLLWVDDVFDLNLGFFEFLDSYREPGSLHLRFAHAATDGMLLLTTNFDDLLEQGIAREGGIAQTIDAHAWTALRDQPVIKLHGTRHVHRSGKVFLGGKSLHATTEVIAAANPGNLLNERANELLTRNVENRQLIIAGYSASDDLDIVPALRALRPSSVTWIDHRDQPARAIDLADLGTEQSSWLSLVRQWAASGVQVVIWRGRSDETVAALGLERTQSPRTPTSPQVWRASIRRWAGRVRSNDPTGLGLAGLLLAEMQRYDLAERALIESRGSRRDATAGWTSARRLYEIAQSELLKVGSDPEKAGRLAAAARKAALRAGDKGTALFSLLLLGRAEFLQQQWNNATTSFAAAIAEAETAGHRAYGQSWLGRTLVWSGRPAAAFRPLRAAASAMRREGNLEGLLDAQDGLGVGEFLRGRIPAARTHLMEALAIADSLGLVDRRFTLEVSLASVAFTAGDLDDAQRQLDVAFALPQGGNDEVAVAWALQADLHHERGDLSSALLALERAIATTTVITRADLAGLHALRAEVTYGLNDEVTAKDAARAALECRDAEARWGARVHAHAVMIRLGEDATSLKALLRAHPSGIDVPTAIALGAMLTRLGVAVPGAATIVRRARAQAARVGATYWERRLGA